VGFLATAANAGPVTLFDNIGADYINNGGVDQIDTTLGIGPLADSFSTGGSSVLLTDLKLLLVVEGTPNPNATVTITLNSDNATAPGAVLTTIGTISDSSIPVGPPGAVFDFPVASFALAANTRYWIQLSTNDGSSAFWTWSLDTSGTGVANEFFFNQLGGGVAFPNSDGPYLMQVNGFENAIPEPSSVALLGVGIGGIVVLNRLRKRLAA
jgi:hypothetical protein